MTSCFLVTFNLLIKLLQYQIPCHFGTWLLWRSYLYNNKCLLWVCFTQKCLGVPVSHLCLFCASWGNMDGRKGGEDLLEAKSKKGARKTVYHLDASPSYTDYPHTILASWFLCLLTFPQLLTQPWPCTSLVILQTLSSQISARCLKARVQAHHFLTSLLRPWVPLRHSLNPPPVHGGLPPLFEWPSLIPCPS